MRLVLVLLLIVWKNWREIFKPITKSSNRNHVITFDSHLKTALSLIYNNCHSLIIIILIITDIIRILTTVRWSNSTYAFSCCLSCLTSLEILVVCSFSSLGCEKKKNDWGHIKGLIGSCLWHLCKLWKHLAGDQELLPQLENSESTSSYS